MKEYFSPQKTTSKRIGSVFLQTWINDQMNKAPWTAEGISEKKYLISFMPLFNTEYGGLKRSAKDLGMSYGVLRKFLSEDKVKMLAEKHTAEYARYFCDSIIDARGDHSPRGLKRFGSFINEFNYCYSDDLFYMIVKLLFQTIQSISFKDDPNNFYNVQLLYLEMLGSMAKKMKNVDRERYLGFSILFLEQLLLFQDAALLALRNNYRNKNQPKKLSNIINILTGTTKLENRTVSDLLEVLRKEY
jgi:hypothetical protein